MTPHRPPLLYATPIMGEGIRQAANLERAMLELRLCGCPATTEEVCAAAARSGRTPVQVAHRLLREYIESEVSR